VSFTNTAQTPEALAELRADHDLRFTPERVLFSWLTEFGYAKVAKGDARVAFRLARAERGGSRLAHELTVHERRMSDRRDVRSARELSCHS
jgi:hypothetical protein